MAYLSFEAVIADASVDSVAELTVPANASHAELQASANHVSYTMDGTTAPTQTAGMFLLITEQPKLFLIADVKNIQYTRGAGADGALNIHYFSGRDV